MDRPGIVGLSLNRACHGHGDIVEVCEGLGLWGHVLLVDHVSIDRNLKRFARVYL